MLDIHQNFGYGVATVAPSPATSGTTMTLTTGDEILNGTPPFNATVWPNSAVPLKSNSEIVRVTAINTSTKVITITRAQESTTARTIVVGDQIAATVTKKVITDIEDNLRNAYNVAGPSYGAKCDGTTDDTTAIQSALDAAATAGGGTVVIPANAVVSNLLIDSYVTLMGASEKVTLIGKSGATGYMIALKTPASTQRVTIKSLTVKPNQTGLGGIKIDNTSNTADTLHVLEDIYVTNSVLDAFHIDNNVRELRVKNCRAYNTTGGSGFYIGSGATDNHFTDCTAGVTSDHGWQIYGYNNMFANCKAFYGGYNGAAWVTGKAGFYVSAAAYCSFVGCSAQQNAAHGFDLQSNLRITVTGCTADTNNAFGGTAAGINTNANTYSSIIGNSGANNAGITPGSQTYGIQVAGTQTGTLFYGNTLTGSSSDFQYVSGGGYMLISGAIADFTNIPLKMNSAQITPRIGTTTSSATPAINTDNYDQFNITALAANITSMTSGLTGTPADGQKLIIRIKAAAAQTITHGTSFTSSGAATLLSTTVAGKTVTEGLVYDVVTAKWICMAVDATGY